jgi:putative oxidoreductase
LQLLGVVAVIQLFVFPGNWPDHLLWASGLMLLLARGPGSISVDFVGSRLLTRGRVN